MNLKNGAVLVILILINILFDPKKDDTRIVGDAWYKISDRQTLSEAVNEIEIG